MAAEYIAGVFRRLGLEPAGDAGSYIQRYALQKRAVEPAETRIVFTGPRGTERLGFGTDFFVIPGATGRVSGEVVYAGAAESAEPSPVLRGRIAMYELSTAGRRGSIDGAAAPGAPPRNRAPWGWCGASPGTGGDDPAGGGALRWRRGSRWLSRMGCLCSRSVECRGPGPGAGGRRRRGRAAAVRCSPTFGRSCRRRYGWWRPPAQRGRGAPGAIRSLRHYVVFSAHFDHVGVGRPNAAGDSIYNGADDNASGTAALLEVAEAFASLPTPPARSLVFLAVSGEEKGLLGSRYYSDHPTVPLESIVANINVDMIGRNAPDKHRRSGRSISLGPLVLEVAAQRPELADGVEGPVAGAAVLLPQRPLQLRAEGDPGAVLLRRRARGLPPAVGPRRVHRHGQGEPGVALDLLHCAEIAMRPEAPQWTEEGLAEVRALTGGGR